MLKKIIKITKIQWLFYQIYRISKYFYFDYTYQIYRKKYKIHNTFKFNGENISFYGDGEIEIGKNTYIGRNSSIQSTKEYSVKIGNNCSISHNVKIYTCNRNVKKYMDGIKEEKKGNVVIKDNCWIGTNTFIGEGVTIGKNSIIGANVVVTKDVGDYEIVKATFVKQGRKSVPK